MTCLKESVRWSVDHMTYLTESVRWSVDHMTYLTERVRWSVDHMTYLTESVRRSSDDNFCSMALLGSKLLTQVISAILSIYVT